MSSTSAQPRQLPVGPARRSLAQRLVSVLTWPRLVAAVIALALVVFYLVFHNGSWVYDDNFFLVMAHKFGFDLTWLDTPIYQHWNPGLNAMFSLLLHLFPIDYRWGLAAALIGLGAMAWMFAASFSLLTRSRPAVFALTVWFVFSILWAAPLQWWTFSVQIFPNIFFDLLCLYAFLRFQMDGRMRWVITSAGAMAVGLLFYEKAAFMLLYLALVRILLMDVPLRPSPQIRAFLHEWRIWTGYVLVIVIWGAAYVSSGAYSAGQTTVPVGDYLRYFRIMWAQTIVPMTLGLSVPALHLTALQTAAVILLEIVVVALVVATIVRRRRVARAWLFLLTVVVAVGLLVAGSRVAQFGVAIAGDRRYLLDFSFLLPIAACAVAQGGSLTPVPDRIRLTATGAATPRLSLPPRPALIAGATALLAYVALSTFTASQLERNWPGAQARQWYESINRGLARYDSRGENAVFADNEVAPEIMGAWQDPYSRLSSVLPLYSPGVRVDGPLVGRLLTVGPTGAIRPAHLQPLASPDGVYQAAPAVAGANRAGLGCYAPPAGEMIRRLLPVQRSPGSATAPVYIILKYRVPRPVLVSLYLATGSGLAGAPDALIRLDPHATRSIAWLGDGPVPGFGLQFGPGSRLCLDGIQVVQETAP